MHHRVLITGASGFIGSALVSALAEAGHDVIAAVREPERFVAAQRVQTVRLPDLSSSIAWEPIVAGADIVVHLAGIAHRGGADAGLYDRAVHLATAQLADACKQQGVNRLIFVSSIGAQTGSSANHVVVETDEPQPVTAYDRAKLAAERAIERSGVPYTVLRPVIVYGSGAKANIALLLRLAKLPIPLPFGAFDNRRSYVARENVVQAIAHCLDTTATLNQTFIVADPEPLSLAEVFTVMRRAGGRQARLIAIPPWMIRLPLLMAGRGAIWDRIGCSLEASSKKLQATGWQPIIDTRTGFAMMVAVG